MINSPFDIQKYENNKWKWDLSKSIPILCRGMETIGYKKKLNNMETVLFLMKKMDDTNYDNLWNPL